MASASGAAAPRASRLPPRGLERVLDPAEELRLTDRRALEAIAAPAGPPWRRAPRVRAGDHVAGATMASGVRA